MPSLTRCPSSNKISATRPATSGRITTDSFERRVPTTRISLVIGSTVTSTPSTGTTRSATAAGVAWACSVEARAGQLQPEYRQAKPAAIATASSSTAAKSAGRLIILDRSRMGGKAARPQPRSKSGSGAAAP